MNDLTPMAARWRGGRPTRDDAARRHRDLLEHALTMVLERGFADTTILDVAASMGTTRRTVYARYADKGELVRAALEHGIEQMIVPVEALDAVDTTDLRSALLAFARLRVAHTLTPRGLQIHRFLHAEALRFPEHTRDIYRRMTRPTSDRVAGLLERTNAEGITAIAEPALAGRLFFSMIIGGPLREALLTGVVPPGPIEDHVAFAVDLFLNGVKRHSGVAGGPACG